jgi:hypothetical protein
MKRAVLLLAAAAASAALALIPTACGDKSTEAAPEKSLSEKPAPSRPVAPVAADRLCVTKGTAALGSRVTEPTMRAVALGSAGDAASLSFVYRGETAVSRDLASGESRRQLGLKLRAQDGCNLVYVMWRLDPKPAISVSVKRNPGKRTHKECGANGYTRIKPLRGAALSPLPALSPGASHTLRAEISGDDLLAWIDDQLVWRGSLPAAARALSGPAGLRSDNVSFDLAAFSAGSSAGSGATAATSSGAAAGSSAPSKCEAEAGD